jgi:hypothetical protein
LIILFIFAAIVFTTKPTAAGEDMAAVRAELKTLIGAWTDTGYTYTGTCYREIAMENSNYGGMENVGNTTIVSSRLTPSRFASHLVLFLRRCAR